MGKSSAARPAGYWPADAQQPPSVGLSTGLVLASIPATMGVVAVLAGRRAVLTGEFEIYGAFGLALALLLLIGCIAAFTVGIALLRPPFFRTADSVIIHRGLWRNGLFYCFACWTGCGALWLLICITAGAWLAGIAGAIVLLVSVLLLVATIQEGRSTLVVGHDGLRLRLPRRDHEFPWDAVSQVRLVQVRVGERERPQLEFHCRASAVVNHRGARESVFANDADVPRPYKILFKGLPVRPEALLATMEFMVANPDQRVELGSKRLADMLA
ncbi:MAG: hypothetical protein JWN03_4746 [Nocardia sp.]|uniref:PH domain-containing protein n=1 Tax=Nocardia sp. TaxID=1821 RepID=UPI00261FD214|nr:PH domain-containing protein [Nocardia sp.]MCU1644471.1 hypothetical protein [Nocardia sp.]